MNHFTHSLGSHRHSHTLIENHKERKGKKRNCIQMNKIETIPFFVCCVVFYLFVTDDWLQLSVCHQEEFLGTIYYYIFSLIEPTNVAPIRSNPILSATNFHTINICSMDRLAELFSFFFFFSFEWQSPFLCKIYKRYVSRSFPFPPTFFLPLFLVFGYMHIYAIHRRLL